MYQPSLWQQGAQYGGRGGQQADDRRLADEMDVPDWIDEDEEQWIARQQHQHR